MHTKTPIFSKGEPLQVPDTALQAPGTALQAPGTALQVPDTALQPSGTLALRPGSGLSHPLKRSGQGGWRKLLDRVRSGDLELHCSIHGPRLPQSKPDDHGAENALRRGDDRRPKRDTQEQCGKYQWII